MAKVQFNCRLREDTIRAINKNAAQWGAAAGRKVSQAEVIERTFDGQMIASTRGLTAMYSPEIEKRIVANVRPRKQTRKEKIVADATANPAGSSMGKATVQTERRSYDFRKNRGPLLKPKDRKK